MVKEGKKIEKKKFAKKKKEYYSFQLKLVRVDREVPIRRRTLRTAKHARVHITIEVVIAGGQATMARTATLATMARQA